MHEYYKTRWFAASLTADGDRNADDQPLSWERYLCGDPLGVGFIRRNMPRGEAGSGQR